MKKKETVVETTDDKALEECYNHPMKHHCECGHHHHLPLIAFMIALVFLLKAFKIFSAEFVDFAWPLLLAAGALLKLVEDKCECC